MDTPPSQTSQGYLVLADISGFIAYMTAVELEHASDIIGGLLQLIAAHLGKVLRVVQIEGDAVLAHAPQGELQRGETLLELIEAAYAAFHAHLISMARGMTCTCAACRCVSQLDLKFLVHYGEYLSRHIQEHHELMGLEPLFVRRREWKEPVAEAAGWRGYVLLTQAGLQALGMKLDGLQVSEFPQQEGVAYGLNLQERYQQQHAARRVLVSPQEADAIYTWKLPAPPHVVWEWINEPHKRNRWYWSILRWSEQQRPGGRSGPGATNHCNHGIGEALETVLDWQPFDYYTVETLTRPGNLLTRQTVQLTPLENGHTCLETRLRLQSAPPRWLSRPLHALLGRMHLAGMKRLEKLLQEQQSG